MCVCVFVCACVACVHVCMHACMHAPTHTNTNTHAHQAREGRILLETQQARKAGEVGTQGGEKVVEGGRVASVEVCEEGAKLPEEGGDAVGREGGMKTETLLEDKNVEGIDGEEGG